MAINAITISPEEASKLLLLHESHFCDLKAVDIAPAKLTKTISALSNAEGGEVYVGIGEDKGSGIRTWEGFKDIESANGHLQAFEPLFPLGDGYSYTFLRSDVHPSLILKIEVSKNRDIKSASNGQVYIRHGAQNLPVASEEALARLKRNKGLTSFETETVSVDPAVVANSSIIIDFMLQVVPTAEPAEWLAKQQLLIYDKPTVAALVLFTEEPQAILPKRSGIKIYRYQTTAAEGSRETLAADPISVEGHIYRQIFHGSRDNSTDHRICPC